MRSVAARGLPAALAAALMLLGVAAANGATTAKRYKGETSQFEPISFTISAGLIENLSFRIDLTCPSGRMYRVRAFDFASIKITDAAFDRTFVSATPKAKARIRGHVRAEAVTGTLTDRTMIKREHHYCSGKTTFRLHK